MADDRNRIRDGLAWQAGVWDRMSAVYQLEVDKRFGPVVDQVIARAALQPGQTVLDLGTGTGAVALAADPHVRPDGRVVGVDISSEMLKLAEERAAGARAETVVFREGSAEAVPARDGEFDVLLASLCFMYVVDRRAAARECARVLRPGGRFVASVWAGPEECAIVRFQQTAGRFASAPPVSGVGPGALADARPFLTDLAEVGINAEVERETLGFDFPDFALAWEVLAGVTTAQMTPEGRDEAKGAVLAALWPEGDGPRHFRNVTQFIVGQRRP